MRYGRIFSLHFQQVFELRSRSFVWFLVSLVNPLFLLMYWTGALQSQKQIEGWSLSTITSYYFLLTIAGAMLMSHIEDDISEVDIRHGNLTKYLLLPFSYFWKKFNEETPYRILQGGFGIVICVIFVSVFDILLTITHDPIIFSLSVISFILAYFLSFNFKLVTGLSAFWLVDAKGFYYLLDIILIIFAGYILPIDLMPDSLATIAKVLPFSYMIYYPITLLQGEIPRAGAFQIVVVQLIWIGIFYFIFRLLWHFGIKKFTGMGQ